MSSVHNLEPPQILGGSLPNSGHVSAEDTNGLYSLVEIASSPGDAAPMHVHQIEDQHVFVIEGTARIPGGCEEVLRLIAKVSAADIPALAARFHITPLGPAPFSLTTAG